MPTLKCVEVRDKNEIETVVLLADTIWREHYIKIISAEQIDYMLKKFQSYVAIKKFIDEGGRYYILDFAGVPIGYFAVKVVDKKLYLDKLYVVKESRGQNFGGTAVTFAKELARADGLHTLFLTVNKHNAISIKAYKSYGFKVESAVVTDVGDGFVMDDYRMYLYL